MYRPEDLLRIAGGSEAACKGTLQADDARHRPHRPDRARRCQYQAVTGPHDAGGTGILDLVSDREQVDGAPRHQHTGWR